MDWALVMVPYPVTITALVTVGFGLLNGISPRHAPTTPVRAPARRINVLGALLWAALCLLSVFLLAVRFRAMAGDLRGLLDSVQVRALLAEAALACVAAVTAKWSPRLALPSALVALVPGPLTGHTLTADSPLVAQAALVAHVVAASLWVGGLLALGWLALRNRAAWAAVLPRYSTLALACVVVLAVSGMLAALQELHSFDQLLTNGYGALVLLKSAGLAGLIALGALQRRRVVRPGVDASGRDVLLLLGSEAILMMLVVALATGLSQTPPPN
ncbi:CopD family protein [Micromonospora sp. NPDC023966]|uniref:copper resistance D family protein n=1 Tax=Micromonospora sp. NPDC023966 TaxID=3154699 RepID=UPI0033E5A16D